MRWWIPILSALLPVSYGVNFQLYGVNYTPRQGPDWDPNRCKSQQAVDEDMAAIKQVTTRVRIYSLAGCDEAEKVLRATQKYNMSVWLGMWVSSDNKVFENELQKLDSLFSQGLVRAGHVLGLHVGSEAIYRKEVTYEKAIDNLVQVRELVARHGQARAFPLTIADIGDTYLMHPALIDAVDIVSANAFPLWERKDVAISAKYLSQRLSPLQRLARNKNKDFMIGESGWSSGGSHKKASDASPESHLKYLQDFHCEMDQKRQLKYFYFTSFDDEWKILQEGSPDTIEAHFGLFYSDRRLKPWLQTVSLTC